MSAKLFDGLVGSISNAVSKVKDVGTQLFGPGSSGQDNELLGVLAEYRVITSTQLAQLLDRNLQALRRRLRQLKEKGYIQITPRGFGGDKGRPAQIISLTRQGAEALLIAGGVDSAVPPEALTAASITSLDHQLLLNDFRVQLVQITRFIPNLSLTFYSSTSPRVVDPKRGYSLIQQKGQGSGDAIRIIEFIPDAVFGLTHTDPKKTLLFFLEVDRGTETLVSPKAYGQDLRRKLMNYHYFLSRHAYKRYETVFNCTLHGFRLLFLTSDARRLRNLCQLVRVVPSPDYIWTTDEERMVSHGIWNDIWILGGNTDNPPGSILGRLKPNPAPTPETLSLRWAERNPVLPKSEK